MIFGTLLVPAAPAVAADSDPDLSVSIRSLDPSRLQDGATVTMTGVVTNNNDYAWSAVQAYLVIPAVPFTTRAQIEEAIDNGAAYTGVRVVDPGTFDDMGDLAPGERRRFSIRVPYSKLGVSGAEGVYPVGVQILGTDTEGDRSGDAIARATTFLPLISSGHDRVPTSVVWPFLMPDYRDRKGDYADPAGLLKAVSAGGRLRNLLDLASNTQGTAATVLIDPALLVGVDDLAKDRHVPSGFEISDAQHAEATRFVDDLLAFARRQSCWVLGFDRPDVLALSRHADLEPPLSRAITRATDATLARFQLSGRKVSWPTSGGVTSPLLRDLRGDGDTPVITTADDLPGWSRRQGSLVQYATPNGPMPLLVNDVLDAGVPGQDSVVTLRQRILSEAALATLQRTFDSNSRADAVTMVDPAWDPGARWATGRLDAAFDAPFTVGTSLESMLTRRLTTYDGKVPTVAKDRPLGRGVLEAAADIVAKGSALSSVVPQSDAVDDARAQDVASVLGVRWRADPAAATTIARTLARDAGSELNKITIKGPPSVTLSSSKGGFPVTIRNGTDEAIRVGVALDSSNPALTVPDVKPVDIAAGERRTLTVDIELGRQNTTSLTAQLTSTEGNTIGQPTQFNVRSSKIGVVLWVAMGLAGLLVLAALVRRFSRRRTRNRVASERLADDDD